MSPLALPAGNPRIERQVPSPSLSAAVLSLAILLLTPVLLASCSRGRHTYDPRLREIDQLLNTHLPPGTPRGLVEHFLKSRGFQLEGIADKTVVRALVRQVDTNTLQPAAARATFHFDRNDRLTTYELESVPAPPL